MMTRWKPVAGAPVKLAVMLRMSVPAMITARMAEATMAAAFSTVCARPTPSTGSLSVTSAIAQRTAARMKAGTTAVRIRLRIFASDLHQRFRQADAQALDRLGKHANLARAGCRHFRSAGGGTARLVRRFCKFVERRSNGSFHRRGQREIGDSKDECQPTHENADELDRAAELLCHRYRQQLYADDIAQTPAEAVIRPVF